MTTQDFKIEEDIIEDGDEFLLEDSEIDLEDIEDEEKEEGIGHRVITMDPSLDGEDNFFDEAYFEN